MGGVARLDLGNSSIDGRPVAGVVASRMAKTASLAALALRAGGRGGMPLGILDRHASRFMGDVDRHSAVSLALVCCPPIIGTLALSLLGASTGWISIAPDHYVWPTLSLALPLAAMLERLQSQAAAEAFAAPDIAAAAARGVPVRRLVWRHASRQALRPVLGRGGRRRRDLVQRIRRGRNNHVVARARSTDGPGAARPRSLSGRRLRLAGATLIAVGNFCADLLRAAGRSAREIDFMIPAHAVDGPNESGGGLLAVTVVAACAAPLLAPYASKRTVRRSRVRTADAHPVFDTDGVHAPFHSAARASKIDWAHRYVEDSATRIPLRCGSSTAGS
jgi:hypothetical protein